MRIMRRKVMAAYNLIYHFYKYNKDDLNYINIVENSNIEYKNLNELFQESSIFTNTLVGLVRITEGDDYLYDELEFHFFNKSNKHKLDKVSRYIKMKNGFNLEKVEEVTRELAHEALSKVMSESELNMYYIEKRISKIEEKLK